MDTLRGNFGASEFPEDSVDFDLGEDDNIRDLPPAAIGQDERRMQVRAYNHWASMLGERTFPAVEELEPQNLDDFGPYSVLLDFSQGIEDPAIQFLGEKLAEECGADYEIKKLSDVPSRSLLSRITDHYMQILANQAPIGFEAEFINQNDVTILYRGILLPFSSDNETIDSIYGVINWKEMADAAKAEELLLEIDQALEADESIRDDISAEDEPLTLTEIAPANDEIDKIDSTVAADQNQSDTSDYWSADPEELDKTIEGEDGDEDFRLTPLALDNYELGEDEEDGEDEVNYSFASLTDHVVIPSGKSKALDLDELGTQHALEGSEFEISFDEGSFDNIAYDGSKHQNANDDGTSDDQEFDAYIEEEEVSEAQIVADNQINDQLHEENTDEEEQLSHSEADDEAVIDNTGIEADMPHAIPEAGHEPPFKSVSNLQPFESEQAEDLPDDASLYDFLASARELAHAASDSEDRSRTALYAAVGRAFDVALAAENSPEEYDELLTENGLVAQDRAPMTPVVKLVFGVDYDKTRLAEYATALGYARRIGLGKGQLGNYLAEADGGLKGVVQAERRLRREEAGGIVEPIDEVRSALADKLRELEPQEFTDIDPDGSEFSVVMIRRTEDGEIVILGEIEQDIPLIERVARKLVS